MDINEEDIEEIAKVFDFDGEIRTKQESDTPLPGEPIYIFRS
jgi:hypothetical protein